MKIVLVLALCLCLISCATIGSNPKDASNLEHRITAFYKAKIAMDFKEAFKYEHMSLDGKFTDSYYMGNAAKSNMIIEEANMVSIDMQRQRDVAFVKMKVKYRIERLPGFEKAKLDSEREIEDMWEFRGGNWYHMIRGMTKNW